MVDLLNSKPMAGHSQSQPDLRTVLLAQKTELISELTRVTANQFNNIMMAITSYAELEMKNASSSQRKSLEQIQSNAGRATTLVQKLLAISRKQGASLQALDLNDVLTGISNLVEQLAGDRLSVVYALDPGIPMVNADPGEIDQVVLDLAINARDAMGKGGQLTISTRLVDLSSQATDEIDQPGEYVMLSISTSHGHRTEELVGDGQDIRTNLSLAAVRGIVRNAGGCVRFNSEPKKGSTFHIYFPALKKEVLEGYKPNTRRNMPVARTILVVEDDDAVRIPTSEFLKMDGFKVLQARTGNEALHVVEQNRSHLDLLITDIVMPKMSGREVAEKLLGLNPDLKVLYMSGDAGEAPLSTDAHRNAILRKPFRLETLTDRIHELLGE
jgi:two-component system cell cycle sensor histidine kinase/response regulator CckA